MKRKRLTAPLLIVATPSDFSNVRYASGFHAVDPMVFLLHDRRVHLVVPLLELGRARQEARRARIWTPAELPIEPKERRDISAWARGLLRRLGVRRVDVTPDFPARSLRLLERHGIRVEVRDAHPFPERAVKSRAEIRNLREAQRAAVAAMKRAVSVVRASRVARDGVLRRNGKPLRSEDLRFEIEIELLRHGCVARDTIVAGGRQAADPHDRGRGPLRAGQTIVLDIFPQHKTSGYWGDITRTIVKGRATERCRAMHRAVRAAHRIALDLVRPGRAVKEIHAAVQAEFERRGFTTETRDGVARGFFHGTGHGVGLDIHEAPSVSLNDAVLREGQVITIEPGLYYPELGGVRIEDTVVVTRRGYEPLARCPYPFEIP